MKEPQKIKQTKQKTKYIIIGFILLLIASTVSSIIESFLFSDNQYHVQFNQRIKEDITWLVIPLIIAPVIEEWLFRGIILKFLNRKLTFVWSNVICAVLFAVAHLEWFLLPYFLNSLIYGWTKKKTGSIYLVMLIHSFYNLIVISTLLNI